MYRVFHLDLTHFEVPDGQLKWNSKYKKVAAKVSLLGVDSLWGGCTFFPADWGS